MLRKKTVMKVLVTGANGLLGANVVRELESRGKEVRVLVRPTAGLSALEGTGAEVVHGDILDRQSLDRAMKGCDTVIHAAANTSQWPVRYSFYEPVNVLGTQNVMEACRENGISRVIYVSTANTFGPGTKEYPGTELSEFSGFRVGSGYMISKYVAQQNVLMEVEKHNTPVVIVNPTFMIGPYDSKPSSGKIILMGLNKRVQVYPDGGKNFIHVRDAATGVCNAMERGRVGGCYLLAHENLTYREFYERLNRVAGQRPSMVKVPSLVLQAAGRIGTLIERTGKKAAPLNHVNARLLTIGNYYSGKKAVQELGLPQTPIETAITEALSWFRSTSMI
jgi:dihydroflavonol-4-reductase